MKISTRGPNVFKMWGVQTYIRFIKLWTPQIFYKAKPKFECVHQSSDTYWFKKKKFKAAGQLQHFKEAKKLKKKMTKWLFFYFSYWKVQNNNFRSSIHVKYLSSVKKVHLS